jgi:hypothetical protein
MTDIGLMVRSAHPVPDDSQQLTRDELSAVLLLAQQRSGEMDVKDRQVQAVERGDRRRGWIVAAASFVAIVLIVGAVWLVGGSTADDAPPATTPPTTEAVNVDDVAESTSTTAASLELGAEAMVFVAELLTDLNEGDVAAATAHFPETMRFQSSFFSVSGIPRWFDHIEALDSSFKLGECKPISGGTTRCEWFRTSEHEPDYPAAEKVIHQFRLENGEPVYAQVNHEKSGWWDVELEFVAWLLENHPDVADTIYSIPGGSVIQAGPRFTDPLAEAQLKKDYVAQWRDATG